MTKNSLIYLQALRVPIIVSFKEAESIQVMHEDNNVAKDAVLHIGNRTFTKGQIKYVEINPDGSKGESWGKVVQEDNAKGWDERLKFLKMSIEAKSEHLDMFHYLFKFSTGRVPTAVEMKKAQIVQLAFYKANPKRMICDFNLLSPIIPKQEMKSSILKMEMGYIRFLEQALLNDMRLSRKSYDDKEQSY